MQNNQPQDRSDRSRVSSGAHRKLLPPTSAPPQKHIGRGKALEC